MLDVDLTHDMLEATAAFVAEHKLVAARPATVPRPSA
jgi:hypothetical protein